MIKLGISGINGKVGLQIIELVKNDKDLKITIGLARNNNTIFGINVISDVEKFLQNCDIIIDFSSANLLEKICDINMNYNIPIVSGTSGLDENNIIKLKELSKTTKILWCMNMSFGVNLMRSMVSNLSSFLPNSEVEILETHHDKKKDSPSGTAIMLGNEIANARSYNLKDVMRLDRNGERLPSDIGFSVRRAGKIVGEHTASFFFGDELIEITHKAFDRKIFAQGAIDAAKKLYQNKSKNGFFDYKDII